MFPTYLEVEWILIQYGIPTVPRVPHSARLPRVSLRGAALCDDAAGDAWRGDAWRGAGAVHGADWLAQPTQHIEGGGCGIAPGLAAELPRPSFRMRAIGEKHYH